MYSASEKREKGPAVLILMSLLVWGILHIITGINAVGPSAYNSYTLQAVSWLQGRMDVENRAYLELAIYQGRYYVSFPPLPSVVLLPFVLVFGHGTPDNLLVKAYALAAVLLMYRVMRNSGLSQIKSVLFSFLFLFGSSLLPLTLEGAVWYHAQTLAFLTSLAAVCLIAMDMPNAAIICYALSVGCRPFNALYGIVIAVVYCSVSVKGGLKLKDVFKRVAPGIAVGMIVAVLLGLYNFARFSDPFEFGHNYLPEFSFQGGKQFSLDHIWPNARTFFFRLPFTWDGANLSMEKFGFSFLIACPVLAMLLFWFVRDIFTRCLSAEKLAVFIVFIVHFMLLLCHRTFGGYQYGARYCVDLMPYALMYRLCDKKHRDNVSLWEWVLLAGGFCLAMVGAAVIHL